MQCALVSIFNFYYLLPTSLNKLNLLLVDIPPLKNASLNFFLLPQKLKFSSSFFDMETSNLLTPITAESACNVAQQTLAIEPITYHFDTLQPADRMDDGNQLTVDEPEPQLNPTTTLTNPALNQLAASLAAESTGMDIFDSDEIDSDITELVKAAETRRAKANERGSLNQKTHVAKRIHTVRVMKQTCIEFTTTPRTPPLPAPSKTPTTPLPSPALDLKNSLVGHVVAVPGKQST